MDALNFSTLCVAPSERADYWADINRAHFGNLDVQGMDVSRLDARMSQFHLGPLKAYLIDGPAHRVSRPERHAQDALDEVYKLILLLKGRASIGLDGRRFDLRPGDWSLYDPRVAYSIDVPEAMSVMVIQVPRVQLQGIAVPELHTCEFETSGGTGLSAVFGSFLGSLAGQLAAMPQGAGAAVSETVVSLLGSTLQSGRAPRARARLPEVMRLRVCRYIQQHLSDPALCIERIAADLRCSKRYLHQVFEDSGDTLERYLWAQRLEHSKALLTRPEARALPISEVAAASGFRSNAHFCRLFKHQFGLTPTDFRRGLRHAA